MEDANSVTTPLKVEMKLYPEKQEMEDTRIILYRELVGALMYAAIATRPDISYAVSFLAQFNHSFTQQHWKLAKRVMRYLVGTKDLGLEYRKSSEAISGFVDND